MMNNLLAIQYNKKHAEQLYQFCEPLFTQCDIKIFGYRKFFINGEYIALCNHHAWQEFYFKKVHDTGKVFSTAIKNAAYKKFTYFLWPQESSDYIISALHSFDIWNGITIYYREDDFIECFAFAGNVSSLQIPNFIINNMQFVEQFILYLKNKAKHIINPQNKNILVKFSNNNLTDLTYENNILDRKTPELEQELYFVKDDRMQKFTNKEAQCIYGLSKGLTYKSIANELNISEKTVETHINNIRNKIGHYSKSDIARLFHENEKMILVYK